ncbi:Histone deacetylase 8 [Trametes pubescens]|uniref:Histone deacetylase 8 n=1 Tax=Trametes pubescens TaxID=154538 RepID=A0A1M2W4P4_TRAPU|nr:Histone deacetylase 8 [Trametes pubescens]
MYLDLDLHFSDGVSQAFHSISSASSSPQVLTFSVHHAAPGFFPISEHSGLSDPSSPSFDPFVLSLPLERGASNATFARVWPIIDRVKNAFRPDYVVVQCGVDGLAGDPYATWNWSLGAGDGNLGWYIDNICRWGCKTLLLGGGEELNVELILLSVKADIEVIGGYNSPNVARAWTYFTSIAVKQSSICMRSTTLMVRMVAQLDHPLSLEADIPDHSAFPLYAPSFILDVPPGNTQDQNTAEYLQHAENVFAQITETIRDRVGTPEARA